MLCMEKNVKFALGQIKSNHNWSYTSITSFSSFISNRNC